MSEERRHTITMTEEDLERIAERAARKAVDSAVNDFYSAVGKTLVGKVLWIVGVGSVVGYFFLKEKGIF